MEWYHANRNSRMKWSHIEFFTWIQEAKFEVAKQTIVDLSPINPLPMFIPFLPLSTKFLSNFYRYPISHPPQNPSQETPSPPPKIPENSSNPYKVSRFYLWITVSYFVIILLSTYNLYSLLMPLISSPLSWDQSLLHVPLYWSRVLATIQRANRKLSALGLKIVRL